ncbi:hypothetical protein R3P38DRAFT_2802393 [Favolaschia claudopus]|uniref:Uncharacterized protein n=1 Tax=Favolaschia claudopus TaxID=2862362 RepID=A0AAV9ZUM6_9AGAR
MLSLFDPTLELTYSLSTIYRSDRSGLDSTHQNSDYQHIHVDPLDCLLASDCGRRWFWLSLGFGLTALSIRMNCPKGLDIGSIVLTYSKSLSLLFSNPRLDLQARWVTDWESGILARTKAGAVKDCTQATFQCYYIDFNFRDGLEFRFNGYRLTLRPFNQVFKLSSTCSFHRALVSTNSLHTDLKESRSLRVTRAVLLFDLEASIQLRLWSITCETNLYLILQDSIKVGLEVCDGLEGTPRSKVYLDRRLDGRLHPPKVRYKYKEAELMGYISKSPDEPNSPTRRAAKGCSDARPSQTGVRRGGRIAESAESKGSSVSAAEIKAPPGCSATEEVDAARKGVQGQRQVSKGAVRDGLSDGAAWGKQVSAARQFKIVRLQRKAINQKRVKKGGVGDEWRPVSSAAAHRKKSAPGEVTDGLDSDESRFAPVLADALRQIGLYISEQSMRGKDSERAGIQRVESRYVVKGCRLISLMEGRGRQSEKAGNEALAYLARE